MEYDEAIGILTEMKSRFKDGFSSTDRTFLENLHRILFGKGISNKSCSDCYRDAYILIFNKLKSTKIMPKAKSQYSLKAGAILRRAGDNKFYANPLPNDEIPELFLAEFPDSINLFASFPADWKARVARRKEGKLPEGELSQEEASNIISGLEADVKARDEEIASLKSELENVRTSSDNNSSEEIGNLNLQIDALTADLESANNEIADLQSDKAKLEEELAALKGKTTKTSKKKPEEKAEE